MTKKQPGWADHKYSRSYSAAALDDSNAALSAHATQLASDIRDREIARNIVDVTSNGSLASPSWSIRRRRRTFTRAAPQSATPSSGGG